MRGGISGGTIDSLRVQLARMRDEPALRQVVTDPEALSGGAISAPGQRDQWRPFVDSDSGQWATPFVMATYNTRIVRRSHALTGQGYGPRFRYRELVGTGPGAKGAVRAYTIAAAMGLLAGAMTAPGLGKLIDRALPSPGQGPSEKKRRNGSFRTETLTTTEDGTRYTAAFAAQGDPGYAATSVMLGQAALCLLASHDTGRSGGLLTPATAIGEELIEALQSQGFTLEVQRIGSDEH
jgi:short subunit dehydrogenase-like uncharacterized protein